MAELRYDWRLGLKGVSAVTDDGEKFVDLRFTTSTGDRRVIRIPRGDADWLRAFLANVLAETEETGE